ncbi:hypothetical protein Ancab_015011 [Ancistrocladus abbreviatus]
MVAGERAEKGASIASGGAGNDNDGSGGSNACNFIWQSLTVLFMVLELTPVLRQGEGEEKGKGGQEERERVKGAYKLKRTNCFTESDVRRHTNSILRGLCFIHKKGFAHCDIKLQNILLFENGAAKIADFGLARRVAGEKKREKRDGGFVFRGTPLYMSPEVVNGSEDGEFCVHE